MRANEFLTAIREQSTTKLSQDNNVCVKYLKSVNGNDLEDRLLTLATQLKLTIQSIEDLTDEKKFPAVKEVNENLHERLYSYMPELLVIVMLISDEKYGVDLKRFLSHE